MISSMSYLTVEVEISGGRIMAREPQKLPENGVGLLTILESGSTAMDSPRPIGLAKGEFVVPPDFNDPLPQEVVQDFEGR